MNQNAPYTPQAPVSPPAAQNRPPMAPPPYVPPVRRTKNKFWTVVWAMVPGAGQMYQGLMKRGVSLMALFAGVIMVAALAYLSALVFLLPVIWFYAFFDTLNRINMTVEELQMQPDEYLFVGAYRSKGPHPAIVKLLDGRHTILGIGLILFAVWLSLKLVVNQILRSSIPSKVYYAMDRVLNTLPSLLIPILCIAIGIKLLAGNKKPVYDEYTIPSSDEQDKAQ